MKNERIEAGLKWCKERKLKSKQLTLFDLQYQKELNKPSRRKRSKKVNEEKAKKISQGIRAKEFKEMCKKARVDQKTLCKTIFTESLKSS